MAIFLVIIVPTDGLAPLGARPSAETVMTKIASHIWNYSSTWKVKDKLCYLLYIWTGDTPVKLCSWQVCKCFLGGCWDWLQGIV